MVKVEGINRAHNKLCISNLIGGSEWLWRSVRVTDKVDRRLKILSDKKEYVIDFWSTGEFIKTVPIPM